MEKLWFIIGVYKREGSFLFLNVFLETDEFTLYKDGKHMIKVQEYRGHIRNWEALCEELCIDKSLSRREREERILVRAFETWQFDMAAHLYGMFAFALWDEEEKQLFCLRDQFGTKPFYYYETEDGQLLYGTTIRGIMEFLQSKTF